MEQQDAMLRELETRNEKLLTDFNSLVRTGASPDTQKFMDDLTAEIIKTRNQRDSFRISRNELVEANEALKRDLQQQLQEVDIDSNWSQRPTTGSRRRRSKESPGEPNHGFRP